MRSACIFTTIVLLCASAAAYTRLTDSAGDMAKWPTMPVSYSISAAGSPQILNGSEFAAIRSAFQTWQNVPSANVQVIYSGTTPVNEVGFDGINLVTFTDSSVPLGSSTIAATLTFYGLLSGGGAIQEADIALNPTFSFSTSGETSKYDIQSIATHEIGHFLGLDHAAMVSSVMAPFSLTGLLDQRTLSYDDIAGITEIYPKNPPVTGKIQGTITSGASPVFGANVVAVDATGTAVVSTLSRTDGTYTLQFVPPGTYRVYTEPLDNPVTPGYLSAFYQSARTNFGTTYFGNGATLIGARTVTVSANGTASASIQTLPQSATGLNLTRPASAVRLGRGISGILTLGGYDITAGVLFNPSAPGISLGVPAGACGAGVVTNCFGGQISVVGPTSAKMDVAIDPSTALGPKFVEVRRNGDTSILSGALVVTDPAPAGIAALPAFGSVNGGTIVTVTGSNFRSGAQVYFGGLAASSVTFIDSGTIQAATPANVPGFSNVVVMNSDGTWGVGADAFGFDLDTPVIDSVSPLSGLPGTVVTIEGNNFGTVTGNLQVTIGGAAVRLIGVTNNTIQGVVPNGAVSGPVAVTVVGQTTAGPAFAVTSGPPSTNAAPDVYSFKDVSISAGGTPVVFGNPDDAVAFVPVPFTFSLFNDVFAAGESMSISTNGWISLAGAKDPASQNSTLPATSAVQASGNTEVVPPSLIAPFWSDLILDSATSNVSVRLSGTAPNRQFVVEWSNAGIIGPSALEQQANITFELVLFEGSNDIQFVWGNMSGPGSDGLNATVGMQDLSRTNAVLTSFDRSSVTSQSEITYHYQNGSYVPVAGVMDPTPPGTPVVTDEGRTANQTQLAASWTSAAPPSGIASFQYGIGTTPGGTDVLGFTSTTQNSAVVPGLSLKVNTPYYFAVKAISGGGVVSDVGVSGGVSYDPSFQPQVRIIPSSPQSSTEFSGIALLAPQGSAESVVLRAFDSTGAYVQGPGILNPIRVSLAAGQQSAKLVSELFGLHTFDGWIQVEASVPGLGVFTATGASDLSSMDGSNAQDTSADFVLFHAGASAIMVNPSSGTASVQITNLATGAVQTLTMPPTSRLVTTIAAASRVKSSMPLAAMEEVSGPGKLTINSAVPASSAQSSLVFPDAVVGNGYSSTLTLVNVTGTEQSALIEFDNTISLYTDIGPGAAVHVPLTATSGASPVRVGALGPLFDSPVPPFVGVVDIDNGADPVTIGAPQASTDFWFPQVANGDGLFTGLAIANGASPTNLTVEVYDSNGDSPQSANLSLGANQQIAQLINQIVASVTNQVGGYIHIHADQPIWAWEIYGSDKVQASGPPL